MPLSLELFGKVAAIFTAGAGVAIPVARTLSSVSAPSVKVERVKLEQEIDLKSLCLIVLQGGAEGNSDSQDKKLIVCQKDKNPETTEFYFYSQSTPFDNSSLKSVESIKATNGNGKVILVFDKNSIGTVAEGLEETISISSGLWEDLNEVNLKSKTKVNLEEKKIRFNEKTGRETYRNLVSWDPQ